MINIKDGNKKKLLGLVIGTLIVSILWTFILYLCLTDYNDLIVEFMKSAKENNLELYSCLILYPIVLIFSFVSCVSNYAVNYKDVDYTSKKSKKRKK